MATEPSVTPVHVARLVAEGELMPDGQRLTRALDPELVWLSHAYEPWGPGAA